MKVNVTLPKENEIKVKVTLPKGGGGGMLVSHYLREGVEG